MGKKNNNSIQNAKESRMTTVQVFLHSSLERYADVGYTIKSFLGSLMRTNGGQRITNI